MTRQQIKSTSLCTSCSDGVFSDLSSLSQKLLTDGTVEFSYSTDIQAIRHQKDTAPCGWCQHLYDDLEKYPMFQDSQASMPLTIIMDIRKRWYIPPMGRHTLLVSVRVNDYIVTRLNYEMFLDLGEPAVPQGIVTSTNRLVLEKSYEMLKQLIDNCDTDAHPHCHPAASILPTRVIDLWPDETTPDRLRLFESSGVTAPYAALSYCWGGPQTFVATLETYKQLVKVGFAIGQLPQTIQDAIATARKLGLRYLWVDALCIIQDSEDDKRQEISQMRNIFKRSYLTIVAAAAKTVNDGFLHSIDPLSLDRSLQLPLKKKNHDDDTGAGTVFLALRHDAAYIHIESVNKRAWTLEEKLLSPRLVIFGEYSLRWQCRSEIETIIGEVWESEAGGSDQLPVQLYSSSKGIATLHEWEQRAIERAWSGILSEYGERDLTHTKDKLVALAGIAEEFQHFWGGKYFAGLWERTLPRDLLWRVPDPKPRLKEYRAPSWSWASVDGEIMALHGEIDITDFEVLECDVSLVSEKLPLGAVTGGRLKVRGIAKKALCNSRNQLVLEPGEDESVQHIGDVSPDVLEAMGESGFKPVWCLQIWRDRYGSIGVALIQGPGDVFHRIGRFNTPEKTDWFRDGQQEIFIME